MAGKNSKKGGLEMIFGNSFIAKILFAITGIVLLFASAVGAVFDVQLDKTKGVGGFDYVTQSKTCEYQIWTNNDPSNIIMSSNDLNISAEKYSINVDTSKVAEAKQTLAEQPLVLKDGKLQKAEIDSKLAKNLLEDDNAQDSLNFKYYLLQTLPKVTETPVYKDVVNSVCNFEVSNSTGKNETICRNETSQEQVSIAFSTSYYQDYTEFEPVGYTFESRKNYNIKFCGSGLEWKKKYYIVPTIFGTEHPELTWWDSVWNYRIICNINSTTTNDLTDGSMKGFCSINTSALILAGKMNSSCLDIRPATLGGVSLPYQVDDCNNPKRNTTIWVNMTLLNLTNSNQIYIYYGNPLALSGESNIWGQPWLRVFHWASNNFTLDSATGNLTGLVTIGNGSSQNITGIFGMGVNFTTGNDHFHFGGLGTLSYAVFVWGKRMQPVATGESYSNMLYTQRPDNVAQSSYGVSLQTTGNWSITGYSQNFLTVGSWTSLVAIVNSTPIAQTYANAVKGGGTTALPNANFLVTTTWRISGWDIDSTSYYWKGSIDEFRVWNASIPVSQDHIQAFYGMTSTLGAEEGQIGNGLTINLTYPVNGAILNNANVNFSFIPIMTDGSTPTTFVNCSLWGNSTGGWALNLTNSSAIINGSTNYINKTFADGVYVEGIQCFGADGTMNFSNNVTFTINTFGVSFLNQNPADLSSLNAFGQTGINFTYQITTANTSTLIFLHKTNSTTNDINYFENGTAYSGYVAFSTYINNSNNYTFNVLANQVYPANYNFNEFTLENTVHANQTLTNANSYLKVRLFNVSNSKQYSFFELMAFNTGSALRLYYCNSTYSAGQVDASPNCVQFASIAPNTPFNHTHTQYSSHYFLPLGLNSTNGKIGNIKVTSTSYFAIRGQNSGAYNVAYISNISRSDTIRQSTNGGTSWTDFAGTIDAHLHQFSGNDSLYYYACANYSLDSTVQNCSDIRQDLMDLGGLAPSHPIITNPLEQTYIGAFYINYTPSISPNAYDIEYYNISLYDSNFSFLETLQGNNSANLSYLFTPNVANGMYFVGVKAFDSNGLSAEGLSQNFSLSNSISIVLTSPNTTWRNTPLNYSIIFSKSSNLSISTCWFEYNATNTTINCSATSYFNATDNTQTNFTLWMNDSADNVASQMVLIKIDTTNPNGAIISPVNGTTYTASGILYLPLTYSRNDTNLNYCEYSITGYGTTTLASCQNTTAIITGSGTYNLTLYVFDLANNSNVSSLIFTASIFGAVVGGGGGSATAVSIIGNETNVTANIASVLSIESLASNPFTAFFVNLNSNLGFELPLEIFGYKTTRGNAIIYLLLSALIIYMLVRLKK